MLLVKHELIMRQFYLMTACPEERDELNDSLTTGSLLDVHVSLQRMDSEMKGLLDLRVRSV
jgi:hypothetical protein